MLARQLSKKNNLKEKPIDEEVIAELQRYAWPGNVRELQNVLERMMVGVRRTYLHKRLSVLKIGKKEYFL